MWHLHRTPVAGALKGVARLAHRGACARRKDLLASLPADAEVIAGARRLGSDGYVMLDALCEPAILEALGQHGARKLERVADLALKQASTHKSFWVRLSDEDVRDGQFDLDNPLVRFALQPRILAVIAHALGEVPQLSDVLLSLSSDSDPGLKYSQLWHRDYDDVRTIKLFSYLTDVDSEADGPFTFIPGPVSDRQRFTRRTHVEDAVVLRGGAVRPVAITGRRLSVFAVETSRCLHMGSRMAPGHSRLLYTATFIKYPRLYPEPPPRFRFGADVDELTRTVLTSGGSLREPA
jgi:hypothetical protein